MVFLEWFDNVDAHVGETNAQAMASTGHKERVIFLTEWNGEAGP